MKKHLRRLALYCSTVCLLALLPEAAQAGDQDLDDAHPRVRSAKGLQTELNRDVLKWRGVIGTAISADDEDDDGNPTLTVYVDEEDDDAGKAVREALPSQLRGHKVRVEFTGKIRALAGKPVAAVSHKAKQTIPIQLGTSGGWGSDLANGYCCGGTLGSLIQANGVQYILSNYHVLESDIVSGGNGIVVTTGSAVVQPGLIDVGCVAASAQNVATVFLVNSLPGSNVDVGVAQVTAGAVRTDGAILEVGTISSLPVAAALNKAVKKSGRTTGLSRSNISGLNATITVTYDNECAGGIAFTKTFTGQIVIANRRSGFLAGGDSGSLMVEDVTANPRAVGLLYAGSNTLAIANPIGEVLLFLGTKLGGPATMVGN